MNTYLFTWNPRKWPWTDLPQAVAEANVDGRHVDRWSCGVTRKIKPGDRAFLIRLGQSPKGIIGSGVITSNIEELPHWSPDRAAKGETGLFVQILFDVLSESPIIDELALSEPPFADHNWYPMASGTMIPPEIAKSLESAWENTTGTYFTPIPDDQIPSLFIEGTRRTRLVTESERNPSARIRCIEHHGTTCSVCGLSFGNVYGSIGSGFIHVHHLTPMADIGESYKIDPVKELCPVCPNCHAMLHRKTPPFTPEELKTRMKEASNMCRQ